MATMGMLGQTQPLERNKGTTRGNSGGSSLDPMMPKSGTKAPIPELKQTPSTIKSTAPMNRENEYAKVQSSFMANPTPLSGDVNNAQNNIKAIQEAIQQYRDMGDYATVKHLEAELRQYKVGLSRQVRQGSAATRPETAAATVSPQRAAMQEGLREADIKVSGAPEDDPYSYMGLSPSQSQATKFLQQKYGRNLSPEEAQLIKTSNGFTSVRQYLVDNNISDFEPMYRALYDELGKDNGLITMTLAEYQFKHATVVDKEINFMACIASIINIIK